MDLLPFNTAYRECYNKSNSLWIYMVKKENFWQKLKKPILCSAPMSGITDAAFRRILAKYAKPDVIFTEFVSCDGLCSEGKENLLKQLKYHNSERPIVAQLFGKNPETFYKSAQLCQKLAFDGIDINMGCPDKNVIKQGAGAALIKTPQLASEIIKAAKKGAGSLPVSVKTRIGYSMSDTQNWIAFLLGHSLAALTLHGRTKKQGYGGKANWQEIAKAKMLAIKTAPKTIIIGNGDVESLDQAYNFASQYNLDGIMVGRALLSNIFFFNKKFDGLAIKNTTVAAKILIEHACLFEKLHPDKNFTDMRKFYKAYFSGFKGANKLRLKLMKANNSTELTEILQKSLPLLNA